MTHEQKPESGAHLLESLLAQWPDENSREFKEGRERMIAARKAGETPMLKRFPETERSRITAAELIAEVEQKPESAEFRTREAQHSQLGEALSDEVSGDEKAVERWYAYALKHILEAEARGAAGRDTYQSRVADWMAACFGPEISADRMERNHRFLEEAIELVQATGCTRSEAHQLVDYVYGRPVGDPVQEVGGVMVTLAALCSAHAIKLKYAAEAELARVWTKVEKIRAKQAAKPKHSPLPEHVAEQRRKDAEPVGYASRGGLEQLASGKGASVQNIYRHSDNSWPIPLYRQPANVAALEARVKELEGENKAWSSAVANALTWLENGRQANARDELRAAQRRVAAIHEGGEHG